MNYPYFNFYPQQQNPLQGRPTYMEQMQQNQSYLGIKGRPVASYDEAKACMIDFDGSIFYFPDAANQKIYTKQINLDGTSSLKVYALVENPRLQNTNFQYPPSDQVVSKSEFDQAIKILNEEIQKLKGGKDEFNESSANVDATINQF